MESKRTSRKNTWMKRKEKKRPDKKKGLEWKKEEEEGLE
jgi:hypothetical protein